MDILCAKTTIDLTAFTNTQNVFITSIERLKELNQLDKASLSKILSAKPNIILYQSYREWQYIKGIIENCYELNTKVIFGYKLSWQDEIIIETTLENADNAIKGKDLNKHTIILIMPNI